MINQLVSSGYVVVWGVYILGLFVYVRSDMRLIASGQNGVELDTLIAKTYGVFIVQLSVALSLVIFPIVSLVIGKHWMGVALGTFYTMFLGLVTMLGIKKVMESTADILQGRREGESFRHGGTTYYKVYNALSWVWLVMGIGSLIALQVFNSKKEYTAIGDMGISLYFVGYIFLYVVFVQGIQGQLGNLEKKNQQQVDKLWEEENKCKRKSRKSGKV